MLRYVIIGVVIWVRFFDVIVMLFVGWLSPRWLVGCCHVYWVVGSVFLFAYFLLVLIVVVCLLFGWLVGCCWLSVVCWFWLLFVCLLFAGFDCWLFVYCSLLVVVCLLLVVCLLFVDFDRWLLFVSFWCWSYVLFDCSLRDLVCCWSKQQWQWQYYWQWQWQWQAKYQKKANNTVIEQTIHKWSNSLVEAVTSTVLKLVVMTMAITTTNKDNYKQWQLQTMTTNNDNNNHDNNNNNKQWQQTSNTVEVAGEEVLESVTKCNTDAVCQILPGHLLSDGAAVI